MLRPDNGNTDSRVRLFFCARGFHFFPGGFGEQQEVVEFAGSLQPLAAIDHYTFAVDVLRHIAYEEGREVGELFMAAETLHGI